MKKYGKSKIKKMLLGFSSVSLALLLLWGSSMGFFAKASENNLGQPTVTGELPPEEEQDTDGPPLVVPPAEGQDIAPPPLLVEPPTEGQDSGGVPPAEPPAEEADQNPATGPTSNLPEAKSTPEANSGENIEGDENTSVSSLPKSESSPNDETVAPATYATGDITVVASPSHTSYQTFTNLKDGSTPPEFTLSLVVTLNRANIADGRIEIPQDFAPNAVDYPDFNRANDGIPFFVLQSPEAPAADSVVESYDARDPSKLVIKLKNDFPAGQQTLAFHYTFNPHYDGGIPVGTVLWKVQPRSYIGNEQVHQDTATEIKTSAFTTIYDLPQRLVPMDENYISGNLSIMLRTFNNYYYQSDFDPSHRNIIYIDLPAGSVVGSKTTAFYNLPKTTVTIDGKTYDRYARNISNTPEAWGLHWHFNGDIDIVLTMAEIDATPPASIALGEFFHVRWGSDYKKINGPVVSSHSSMQYQKTTKLDWNFHTSTIFRVPGATAAVTSTVAGSAAKMQVFAGWPVYSYPNAPKNMGTRDITGVRQEFYQDNGTAAEKANFQIIEFLAVRDTADPANIPPWSRYRAQFEVKNALTGSSSMVDGSSFTPNATGDLHYFVMDQPKLKAGEYIQRVIVIPMGLDGKTEGALPTGNGWCVAITGGAWPTPHWPNGTPMAPVSAVPLNFNLYYNNEADVPTTLQAVTDEFSAIYYAQAGVTSAKATLVSGNNLERVPGETVNYSVQATNDFNWSISKWANPRIAIRVPVQLELQNSGNIVLNDARGGAQGVPVTVTQTGSDANFNYYSLVASGYSADAPAGPANLFNIPLEFKVAAGTMAGSYPFDVALVSSEDATTFNQINQPMNNQDATAALYGFASGDNYSGNTAAGPPLTVISQGRLAASTAVKGNATGGLWVANPMVPAEKGETVSMKVTIKNTGVSVYENIRLYNILPFSGDAHGSTGAITFEGVEGISGAEVRYTDEVQSNLPPYAGMDLQTATFADGWATNAPANPTAIFIDFGDTTIQPNDTVEAILKFKVPNAADQTAFNQICYSAKELGTTAKLTLSSTVAGFSTESIMVGFEGNKPAGAPASSGDVTDIPAAVSSIMGFLPNNALAIPSGTPNLVGYRFTGWNTQADGGGTSYAPASSFAFTVSGTVTLYAQWVPTLRVVTLKGNQGTPATQTQKVNYGESMTPSLLSTLKPSRTHYTFNGWNTAQDGSGTPFTGTTIVLDDLEVFAQWQDILNLEAADFGLEHTEVAALTDASVTTKAAAKGYTSANPATTLPLTVDFSVIQAVAGTYPVTFTLTGSNLNKTVVAAVTDGDHGSTNPTIREAIQANDFMLEAGELASLTDALYLQKGQVLAWSWDASGNTTPLAHNSIVVNAGSVQPAAGTYPVHYTTQKGTKVTAYATVKTGDEITIDPKQGEAIQASNFSVKVYQVAGLTATDYTTNAGATAWSTDGRNTPLAVTGVNFGAVQASAGSYPVVYSTAAGTSVTAKVTVLANTLTLVKFNGNGADVQANPASITLEEPANLISALPANPSRTHYTFNGWNTAKDGSGTPFTESTIVTANLEVFAQWQDILNLEAADFGLEHTEVAALTDDSVTAKAAAKGYTSANPATTLSLTVDFSAIRAVAGTYPVVFSIPGSSTSKTVVATVTDGDHGSTNPTIREAIQANDFMLEAGELASLTDALYLQKGQVLAWSWDASGNTTPLAHNSIVVNASSVQPAAGTYPVYYTTQKGTNVTAYATVKTGDEITIDPKQGEAIQASNFSVKVYQVAGLTATDYTTNASATAWSTDGRNTPLAVTGVNFGAVQASAGSYPVVYSTAAGTSVTAKVAVLANTLTLVKFNGNGADVQANPASITLEEPATLIPALPADPSRTGHTFLGWNTAKDGSGTAFTAAIPITGDTTVYAQWSVNSYPLHFNTQGGGTNPPSQTLVYGTLAAKPAEPSVIGHSFVGWFTHTSQGIQWNFTSTTMPAGDTTLYAHYLVNPYQVTFDYNGAGPNTHQTVDYDALVIEPAQPDLYGYTFLGWKTENGRPWSFAADTMPDKNITLVAQWERTEYTISFIGRNDFVVARHIRYAGEFVPYENAPSEPGHHFVGWGVDGDSANRWNFFNPMLARNMTLVALYDKNPPVEPSSSTSRPVVSPTSPSQSGATSSTSAQSSSKPASSALPDSRSAASSTAAVVSSSSGEHTETSQQGGNTTEVSTTLGNGSIPLFGFGAENWSLLTLILTLLGGIISVIISLNLLLRRRKINSRKTVMIGFLATFVGILSLVVFLLTTHFSYTLSFINSSTIWFTLAFVLQMALSFLMRASAKTSPTEGGTSNKQAI